MLGKLSQVDKSPEQQVGSPFPTPALITRPSYSDFDLLPRSSQPGEKWQLGKLLEEVLVGGRGQGVCWDHPAQGSPEEHQSAS